MKILSNFDTNLMYEIETKYQKEFGENNVLLIRRAHIFFVLHVLAPCIGLLLIVMILILIAAWDTSIPQINLIKNILAIVMIFVAFFGMSFGILKKYFDYTMDFCVVTPQQILHYNQQGILNRQVRSFDIEKIKSVNHDGGGLLESFFNYGTINILAEGDNQGMGDLVLYYVHDSLNIKNQISKIKIGGEKV